MHCKDVHIETARNCLASGQEQAPQPEKTQIHLKQIKISKHKRHLKELSSEKLGWVKISTCRHIFLSCFAAWFEKLMVLRLKILQNRFQWLKAKNVAYFLIMGRPYKRWCRWPFLFIFSILRRTHVLRKSDSSLAESSLGIYAENSLEYYS